MPEFILDINGVVQTQTDSYWWDNLDEFTRGYIEALFFTETSSIPMVDWHTEESRHSVKEGTADGNLPNDAGFSDLHPDSLDKILADCAAFQADNAESLALAYALEPGSESLRYANDNLDDRRAGQLFWYARNGHGVTWMDDGNASILGQLQERSEAFGEVNPWFSESEDPDSPTGLRLCLFRIEGSPHANPKQKL